MASKLGLERLMSYDMEELDFLDYVLDQIGFGAKSKLWMRECQLDYVLINGTAKGYLAVLMVLIISIT